MKDFDLNAANGGINVECTTDGGIGIYYETNSAPHNTLILSKEEFLKLAAWVVARAEEIRSLELPKKGQNYAE